MIKIIKKKYISLKEDGNEFKPFENDRTSLGNDRNSLENHYKMI